MKRIYQHIETIYRFDKASLFLIKTILKTKNYEQLYLTNTDRSRTVRSIN